MAEARYSLGGGAYPSESGYGQATADIDMHNLCPDTPNSYNTAFKVDGRSSMGYADSMAPSQSDRLIQGQPGSPLPNTYYFDNDKEGYNAGGVSCIDCLERIHARC